MNGKWGESDIPALRKCFSELLKDGVTGDQARKMVDRFVLGRKSTSLVPAWKEFVRQRRELRLATQPVDREKWSKMTFRRETDIKGITAARHAAWLASQGAR